MQNHVVAHLKYKYSSKNIKYELKTLSL